MNQVSILGRLVREPDLKMIGRKKDDDLAMCRFTVAVNRDKDNADFIGCIAWGRMAENIDQYFSKGDLIAITGRIQTGSYENKDGDKVYTTDVVVTSFDFCQGRKKDEDDEEDVDVPRRKGRK